MRGAHETGVPIMRPMVLDWPNDPAVWNLTTQHMLGDSLLVGQEERVYLPRGGWVDFWTGRRFESGGAWFDVPFEEPAGGPLLVAAGAILPLKSVSSHLEAEPWGLIVLDTYPTDTRSELTLYEDDGQSYAYEAGAHATTVMSVEERVDQNADTFTKRTVHLEIGARTGQFEATAPRRAWLVLLHLEVEPESVCVDDLALDRAMSKSTLLHRRNLSGWWWDERSGVAWVKPQAGWYLDWDERGPSGDPERDTLCWTDAAVATGKPISIDCKLKRRGEIKRSPKKTDFESGSRPVDLPWTSPDAEMPQDLKLEAAREAGEVSAPASVLGLAPESASESASHSVPGSATEAAHGSASKPVEPDRIALMVNPPERIALRWGDWLPFTTTVYGTLMAGERVATEARKEICLEVIDAQGVVVATHRKQTHRGRVEFPGIEYRSASGDLLLRLSCDELLPVEARVRPAPAIPGNMR